VGRAIREASGSQGFGSGREDCYGNLYPFMAVMAGVY
jgi:hypothetical protein